MPHKSPSPSSDSGYGTPELFQLPVYLLPKHSTFARGRVEDGNVDGPRTGGDGRNLSELTIITATIMLGVRKVSTSLQWQPKPYMLIEYERSKEGRKKERKTGDYYRFTVTILQILLWLT